MGGDEGEHLLDPLIVRGGMPAFMKRLRQCKQKFPELQKPLLKLQLMPLRLFLIQTVAPAQKLQKWAMRRCGRVELYKGKLR